MTIGDKGAVYVDDITIIKDNYRLLLGDCLTRMKEIPDGSVDMVLCDPPYGMTQCRWDTIIPFESLWEQYNRIIKQNGAICSFGSEPFASRLRLSQMNMYRYDWVWEKTSRLILH